MKKKFKKLIRKIGENLFSIFYKIAFYSSESFTNLVRFSFYSRREYLKAVPKVQLIPGYSELLPKYSFETDIKYPYNSVSEIWRASFQYKKLPLKLFSNIQSKLKVSNPIYWDIGANTGISALQLAKKFSKYDGKVVAFECEPENYVSLINAKFLNKFENFDPFPIAFTKESSGTISLNLNSFLNKFDKLKPLSGTGKHTIKDMSSVSLKNSNYSNKCNVLSLSVDSFLSIFKQNAPTYIFIDAAFAEEDIMFGMEKLLKNSKNSPLAILVEYTPLYIHQKKFKNFEDTPLFNYMKNFEYSYEIPINDESNTGHYYMVLFVKKSVENKMTNIF